MKVCCGFSSLGVYILVEDSDMDQILGFSHNCEIVTVKSSEGRLHGAAEPLIRENWWNCYCSVPIIELCEIDYADNVHFWGIHINFCNDHLFWHNEFREFLSLMFPPSLWTKTTNIYWVNTIFSAVLHIV